MVNNRIKARALLINDDGAIQKRIEITLYPNEWWNRGDLLLMQETPLEPGTRIAIELEREADEV